MTFNKDRVLADRMQTLKGAWHETFTLSGEDDTSTESQFFFDQFYEHSHRSFMQGSFYLKKKMYFSKCFKISVKNLKYEISQGQGSHGALEFLKVCKCTIDMSHWKYLKLHELWIKLHI